MSDSELTSSQVAAILGCSVRAVSRHASQQGIGRLITSRLRLYSRADVDLLRGLVRSGPGNPLMGKGQPENYNKKGARK